MPDVAQAKSTRVFPAAPRTASYFSSECAERARTGLVRCVERMDGPALLIGPSGSGKSLLLAVLAESFRFQLSVAVLAGGSVRSRRELHQGILYALGLDFRGLDEGELRLSLLQRLEGDDDSREGVLLLVDEAQSLVVEALEELRMLTNIVRDGASRVQLILAGTPDLEDVLTDARLASLQQRVALRCYLSAMSRAETKAYIQAHLSAARREPGLFTAEAIAQVYEHTEGLPRLINQLCDHALLLALADGREPLDADLIGEAWADLQQLPTMHIGEPLDDFGASGGDILEFGALADHERPVERIGAIQEQLASISMESATGPRSFNRFDSADAGEVDFSLPENEWPELEVVLRESAAVAAGDYVDEEVIADPFHKSPAFHTPHWPPAREPAIPGTGGGQIVAPASVAAGNVPPLESVPLMVHVETNLFAPDPVWPDEELHDLPLIRPLINQEPLEAPAPAAQIVVPGGSARPDHSPPPSRVPPPATARRHGPKRFAKLFSSLQD